MRGHGQSAGAGRGAPGRDYLPKSWLAPSRDLARRRGNYGTCARWPRAFLGCGLRLACGSAGLARSLADEAVGEAGLPVVGRRGRSWWFQEPPPANCGSG